MTDTAIIRGFSFGTVVSGSFAVFFRNLIPFLFFAFLLTVPGLLYDLYVPEAAEPRGGLGISLRDVIGIVVDIVCSTLLGATLVYGTVQELRGRHASLLASIGQGLRVILPALGVGLVAGIGIAIGLVLLIVPGLVLLTIWWVAMPATVVERLGTFASLGRSLQLTRGFRWPIFGIVLLFGVLTVLILFLLGVLLTPMLLRGNLDPVTFIIIVWAAAAVISAFTSVLAGVGYFTLRVEKEGVDLDQVAAVFD
jgi:hypothetical protein